MKKSALFILFALISVAGFSQITGWNAKVGMNISNYTGDADLNAKIGFKLGGGFEYAFDNTWSLQPSLFLSTKGAKKDGNSINAMYLELPVMAAARFNVADNTNIVVNAGPYLACGIAGKTKIDLGNDTERKYDTFGDDALKRFDAGLGVGVALELGKVIVGLDGQFGLVDGRGNIVGFLLSHGYRFLFHLFFSNHSPGPGPAAVRLPCGQGLVFPGKQPEKPIPVYQTRMGFSTVL